MFRSTRYAITPRPEVVSDLQSARYSRDSVLIAHIVEIALAHGAIVLTTNLLHRPGEVFARTPPFLVPETHRPFAGVTYRGLSDVHADVFAMPSRPGAR